MEVSGTTSAIKVSDLVVDRGGKRVLDSVTTQVERGKVTGLPAERQRQDDPHPGDRRRRAHPLGASGGTGTARRLAGPAPPGRLPDPGS